MIADYTFEELLLLADMWDSEFSIGSSYTAYCRVLMERLLMGSKSPNKALHLFLEELDVFSRLGEKPILTVPLEEMPLYINHSFKEKVILARWRLQVAK